MFEAFIEYTGCNNSKCLHGYPFEKRVKQPNKQKKENKPGDLFTLKTFKTDPNLNVHPDMSHINKSETKIFFKKGNIGLKSTIPPRDFSGS